MESNPLGPLLRNRQNSVSALYKSDGSRAAFMLVADEDVALRTGFEVTYRLDACNSPPPLPG